MRLLRTPRTLFWVTVSESPDEFGRWTCSGGNLPLTQYSVTYVFENLSRKGLGHIWSAIACDVKKVEGQGKPR